MVGVNHIIRPSCVVEGRNIYQLLIHRNFPPSIEDVTLEDYLPVVRILEGVVAVASQHEPRFEVVREHPGVQKVEI